MRQPFIAGNWKMNTTLIEAEKLAGQMEKELNKVINAEKVLCPPFVSLSAVRNVIKGGSIKLGAQNLYFEEKGAYTGEVSAGMLEGICEYVILGHSERRKTFHETDQIISRKIAAAIGHGIKPILCIGEDLEEYELGKTQEIVEKQIQGSLSGINDVSCLIIAYEPIWAIGTGRAADGPSANRTVQLIRRSIAQKYSLKTANEMRILYGGSVTSANIAEFASQPEIDGALVGGASLKAIEFIGIVKKTAEIRNA